MSVAEVVGRIRWRKQAFRFTYESAGTRNACDDYYDPAERPDGISNPATASALQDWGRTVAD